MHTPKPVFRKMVSTMFPVSTDHQKNVFLLKKYKTMCITSSCKYLIPRLYLPHMFDHEICFAGITAETLMENQVVHGVTSMTQDHPRNGTIVMCVCVKKVRLFKKRNPWTLCFWCDPFANDATQSFLLWGHMLSVLPVDEVTVHSTHVFLEHN